MRVEVELPARMFIDQLSKREQDKLSQNLHSLANVWGRSSPPPKLYGTGAAGTVYSLIAGRDADLTRDDIARLEWRARSLSIGAYRMP
jgi:hypothetical protein